jgi:hypothetical protein
VNGIKVLFLDVDGVLNSREYDAKCAMTGGDLMAPDPRLVIRMLGIVQDVPELKIVLTSSWRRDPTIVWPFPVYDVTPRVQPEDGRHPRRADEIGKWIADHLTDAGDITFAVLDDEPDAGIGFEDRFVQTDPRTGLTAADAARVVGLFM